MSDHQVTRRNVLAAGGAAVAAITVVGCGAQKKDATFGGANGSTPTGGATDTPSVDTSTSSGGASSSTGGGDTNGLVALSDVPVGGSTRVKDASGNPVAVAQPSAGEAVAFSAICTHMGCTVDPDGSQLKCPCHGSVYNAFTGDVVSGPAPAALASVPVKVKNGEVVEA